MTHQQPDCRTFLGWQQPVAELCARWLLDTQLREGFSLAHCLVVVPTANAGRILSEELLKLRQSVGTSGLLAPEIMPPQALLNRLVSASGARSLLSNEECELAWQRVLSGCSIEDYPGLFPSALEQPVELDRHAIQGLAARLAALRRSLAEGGYSIQPLAEQSPFPDSEAERWRDLARLEARYLQQMQAAGFEDPELRKIQVATASSWPLVQVESLVFAGLPDPLPLVMTAAEKFVAVGGRWHVLVHAPDELKGDFDAAGRPLNDSWAARGLADEVVAKQVHLLHGVSEQANMISRAVLDARTAKVQLSIGSAARDALPEIEHSMRQHGLTPFDPGGIALRANRIHQTLAAFTELMVERSFVAAQLLLRKPLVHGWLQRRGILADPAQLLKRLDDLAVKRLPVTLDDAIHLCTADAARPDQDLKRILIAVRDTIQLKKGSEAGPAIEWLQQLIRELVEGIELTASDRQTLENYAELAHAAGDSAVAAGLPGRDLICQIIQWAAGRVLLSKRPPDAVPILGWLELHWETSPWLAVVSCSDGNLPEVINADTFLPERLRLHLGLSNNRQRLARDSYLLAAILAQRQDSGQVDLLIGRHDTQGSPVAPSRLLLNGAGKSLPARVKRLFQFPPPQSHPQAQSLAWTLQPVQAGGGTLCIPEKLSVTALASYLSCPFRFYLSQVLRMQGIDDGAQAMDERAFGTLCHKVMQAWAESSEYCNSSDEDACAEFAAATTDLEARNEFGPNPSVPLQIQFEIAKQRTVTAARLMARQAAAGWRVVESEWLFGKEGEFAISGMPLRGRIDLIQQHVESGEVRVLDFKTSDSPVTPEKAHISSVGRSLSLPPEYALLDGAKKKWTNLQLPVYCLAVAKLRPELAKNQVQAGYVHLAHAVEDTQISIWDGLEDYLADAENCTAGIIADIRSGRFWPPSKLPANWDDFEDFFYAGDNVGIDPSLLLGEGAT